MGTSTSNHQVDQGFEGRTGTSSRSPSLEEICEMLRSIASNGAVRSALSAGSRRNMAIMPTVKTATDTSADEFPAPSHVSLVAEASAIARQFREFYSNPGTFLESVLCS